jgi:phosphoglucosamine mutase
LERHLKNIGLDLLRTGVGDRYVVEAMRAGGFNLGGEQSGHIVMTDYGTTGDGLISALQFLAAMVETGKPASELSKVFEPVPQLLQNVRYKKGADPLSEASVMAAISAGEERLAASGRLLIRKSGTEPLVRVMGESEDEDLLKAVINDICIEVEKFA